MNTHRLLLIFATSLIGIFAVGNLNAQGVLFSEYRLILANQSIVALQVCNPTEETLRFKLSYVNKYMDENGAMHEVADTLSPEFSLKPYLRIYPRNITLDPGKCQEVQIQLKAPASLRDGEYRSYLHFLPLRGEQQDSVNSNSGVKLAIVFRVGTAIPIIYRKNTSVEEVSIDSVALKPRNGGGSDLEFIVKRKGTQSTYGRFLVEGTSEGAPVVVMDAPGSSVFTEIDFKRVSLPISTEKLDCDSQGRIKLKISYIDAENKTAKTPVVLASKEVEITLAQ